MFVKSKDTVIVLTGKDKGKKGKVTATSPKTGKVIVEGIALVTKHQKARQQGMPGGIIHKEAFIDASNVMLVCPKCGQPTRVGHKLVDVTSGGKTKLKSVRVCKKAKCGAQID